MKYTLKYYNLTSLIILPNDIRAYTHKFFHLCFLFLNLFLTTSYSPVLANTCENQDTGYWIGSNSNEIFDETVLQEIADCAGLIVLNIPLGLNGQYKSIVKRLHNRSPKLPILGYTWLNTYYKRPRIGSSILEGVTKHQDWRLLSPTDSRLFRHGKKAPFLVDITNSDFTKWAINNILRTVDEQGLDGIALDVVFRTPLTGRLGYWCKKSLINCKKYSHGVDTYLKKLKAALGNKLLFVNGFYPNYIANRADQEKLLNHVDGIAIEYFGYNRKLKTQSFQNDILPYLKLIKNHPKKKFLVFGREPKPNKPSINTTLGKYLYASYLLVARENTFFKFHSSFQFHSKKAKRSGGIYLLDDQKYNLGKPLSNFKKTGQIYKRFFSRGFVAVNPDNSDITSSIELKKTYYDAQGHSFSGKTRLQPGQALILFSNKVL